MAATEASMLSSVELCELTGMSYRMLDYWCRNGVIPGGDASGSGSRRTFDADITPRVEALVRVAKAFTSKETGQLSIHTYADIYENYNRGYVELTNGVRITWPTQPEVNLKKKERASA